MRNRVRVSICAVLVLACACASNGPPPPQAPVAATYAPITRENDDLRDARKLAIEEVYRRFPTRALVEGVTAEAHTGKDRAFRFRITMSGAPETRPVYEAIVVKPQFGEWSVISLTAIARPR
jgi:hypothetical protein